MDMEIESSQPGFHRYSHITGEEIKAPNLNNLPKVANDCVPRFKHQYSSSSC